MIQALVKRGVHQRDIAAQLGVHPKTVSRTPARDGARTPHPQRRPAHAQDGADAPFGDGWA